MLPAFAVVEAVTLEVCAYSDLKVGETVIFWHERAQLFVHHRIIARQGPWLITQGDNNSSPDTGFLTADNFVGRTRKLTQ